MLLKNRFQIFFDRVTLSGGGPANSGNLSDSDNSTFQKDMEILNQDEPEESETEEEPETEEEETETEEEDGEKKLRKQRPSKDSEESEEDGEEESREEEEEETEGDEEGEEETQETEGEKDPVRESLYKQIKGKYKNFFKDFPQVKNDLFALNHFRRVFPTVDEAKDASETVENYNAVKDLVEKGDSASFLTEVKNLEGDSFKRFSVSFLPSLYKLDQALYYGIVTPVVKTALRSVINKGTSKGGKIGGKDDTDGQNLVNAAIVAYEELFGNRDINKQDEPLIDDEKENPDKKKLDKERDEFYQQKYNELRGTIANSVTSRLDAEISKGLDPTNSLSSFVKKHLVREIRDAVDSAVAKNESHMRAVNSMWDREGKSGYSGAFRDRIVKAYINTALPLIPAIRQRLRSEALKDSKKRVFGGERNTSNQRKTSDVRPGTRTRSNAADARDTSKMSDLDIINS